MTPQEIDAMEAGRELDTLVGSMVFGIDKWCPGEDEGICFCDRTPKGTCHMHEPLINFSTDISAAWEVVEKLSQRQDKGECFEMGNAGARWWFNRILPEVNHEHKTEMTFADTMPLAICRAALKAVLSK